MKNMIQFKIKISRCQTFELFKPDPSPTRHISGPPYSEWVLRVEMPSVTLWDAPECLLWQAKVDKLGNLIKDYFHKNKQEKS